MTDYHITEHRDSKVCKAPCASLPMFAYTSLNRCNVPAYILGSHTYQQHPIALSIDCVTALHHDFFNALANITSKEVRALHFHQYMCSAFLLGKSDEAGFTPQTGSIKRDKADYLRLLRGWMFNAEGVEAAVMKRWVESRFGLLTLNHNGLLNDPNCIINRAYQSDYVRGLYNSNALEAQLDLLYTYCQYELQRILPLNTHYLLYRGVNHLEQHHKIGNISDNQPLLLLNNLNSFTSDRDFSGTFGDVILETQVPYSKILYFPELLNGVLKGENEYLVVGGIYQTTITR
ncbi:NAD(+)--dinitrogen-reductase ADP-D-ribosyltransferase [Psychromonas sp. MME1]|uniref:NAD(+)--dinitrogen-reductase ADP-D-ribosyltransferase n=1 Tax=Psychromonas sp. MME1 TaxID=3231032 RepID=UPI0034E23459